MAPAECIAFHLKPPGTMLATQSQLVPCHKRRSLVNSCEFLRHHAHDLFTPPRKAPELRPKPRVSPGLGPQSLPRRSVRGAVGRECARNLGLKASEGHEIPSV